MNPQRLAPWVALFAALLLFMQFVWLMHLAFISSDKYIIREIYCGAIILPMWFFVRAGWSLLCGQTNKKNYLRAGSIISILIGLALMLVGSMTSIAVTFTTLFCFFAAIAGCLALIFMTREARKEDNK